VYASHSLAACALDGPMMMSVATEKSTFFFPTALFNLAKSGLALLRIE